MNTDIKDVTGAVAEVDLVVDLPIDEVWELITDISRIGEWSPECVSAAWRPDEKDDLPRVGAWFDARNEYPGGYTSTVECVVTRATRPTVFEWVVLDDDQDVGRPGSIWRYDLASHNKETLIRHRFTHGAGMTGLREGMLDRPDRAEAVLAGRLAVLRTNMTATLRAMMDSKGAER